MEIYRCDRCKCLIENCQPIFFKGINKNIEVEKDGGEKENSNPLSVFSLWTKGTEYESETWQLCIGCAKAVFHWLGHSENKLRKKAVIK